MDIIALIQEHATYIVGVISLIGAIATWKWSNHHIAKRTSRLEVLHIKKIAGNISQAEREYLEKNDKWRLQQSSQRTSRNGLTWKKFTFKLRALKLPDVLDKLNPLANLHREVKRLRGDHERVNRRVNELRVWELRDRIKDVEKKVEHTPTLPEGNDILHSGVNIRGDRNAILTAVTAEETDDVEVTLLGNVSFAGSRYA